MNPTDPFYLAVRALGSQLGLVPLVGLGLLVLVILVAHLGRGAASSFPYQRAGALFTPAEAAFLHALQSAVGPELLVFGKVRLADLLQPREGLPRQRFFQALNRITGKHADFVLVDRDSRHAAGAAGPPRRRRDQPGGGPADGSRSVALQGGVEVT